MQDQSIEEDCVLFPFQEVSFIMASSLFLQQHAVKVKKGTSMGLPKSHVPGWKGVTVKCRTLGSVALLLPQGELLGGTSCHAPPKIRGLRRHRGSNWGQLKVWQEGEGL